MRGCRRTVNMDRYIMLFFKFSSFTKMDVEI